jgi:hypothetical protein
MAVSSLIECPRGMDGFKLRCPDLEVWHGAVGRLLETVAMDRAYSGAVVEMISIMTCTKARHGMQEQS